MRLIDDFAGKIAQVSCFFFPYFFNQRKRFLYFSKMFKVFVENVD